MARGPRRGKIFEKDRPLLFPLAVTGTGMVTRRTELLMPAGLQPESGWLSGDRRSAFVLLGDQAGLWELPNGRLRRLLSGSLQEVWCGALSADALVTMACRLLRGQSEAAQVAALCAKAK